jgi:hypothetical protein
MFTRDTFSIQTEMIPLQSNILLKRSSSTYFTPEDNINQLKYMTLSKYALNSTTLCKDHPLVLPMTGCDVPPEHRFSIDQIDDDDDDDLSNLRIAIASSSKAMS